MKPENVTCPNCRGPMVSRTNRADGSRFWGCKAFPRCLGTRNADGESRRAIVEEPSNDDTPSTSNPRWRDHDTPPSQRWHDNDRRRW